MDDMEKNSQMIDQLKYNADGLIPAIIQDINTGDVLMMAYMNRDSLQKTMETGHTWFWSRSRQCYWQKGESSGHVQNVKSIFYDCDADTLLIKVEQKGMACHTGHYTCFFNPLLEQSTENGKQAGASTILSELTEVIRERKEKRPEDSYVASLLGGERKEVARKVGEEAMEVVLAFEENSNSEIIKESADLLFHLMVMLESQEINFNRVLGELAARRAGDKNS